MIVLILLLYPGPSLLVTVIGEQLLPADFLFHVL